MNRINTSTWVEVGHLHSKCLCYAKKKGLYICPISSAIEEDILVRPHGYKGFWNQDSSIQEEGLNIRVESNFGYGSRSYLKAAVEKNGKAVLDFDKSKIYILNNSSVMTHDVVPYEWEDLFIKIIDASKVSNINLCTSSAISYIEEIGNVLDSEEIQIKGHFSNEKSTKWSGQYLLALHAGNKIRDLINGCYTAEITDSYFIDKTIGICQKFLDKIKEIDIDLTDKRTCQLSESLFSIHEFMSKNKHGLDFFGFFIGKSQIQA